MKLEVYIDGSYDKAKQNVVTGGTVILYEGKPVVAQRYESHIDAMTSMNNVGGELGAAIAGIGISYQFIKMWAEKNNLPDPEGEITVYHDYKGIKEFVAGNPPWKPSKEGSKMYVIAVMGFKKQYPKVKLNFVKVKSHTGNKWNEVVDRIAAGVVPLECKGIMLPDMVVR